MRLTDGFRLSDDQIDYLRQEFKDLNEKLKEGKLEGTFRMVARQEALLALYDLHKIEVKRIKELGDNVALTNFVQSKEI